MNTSTQHTPVIRFEDLNWVATTPLARDQEQSHRLHEPNHLVNTIDPITGRDIWNLAEHPSILDGNLTIYFESEESRAAFEKMQVNHPFSHFRSNPSEELDRGG
jgi:YHS domain-containing protein